MTTRRQDSGETWGNKLKRRRSQGNLTEEEKKTTRGKMLVSRARQTTLIDRKKNPKTKKGPQQESPSGEREEAGRIISDWSLILTLDDGRRMCSGRSRPGSLASPVKVGNEIGTGSGNRAGVAVVRDVAKYSCSGGTSR